MTIRTISIENGKYEFDRDEHGIIVAARRNGERWVWGESYIFSKCVNALLDRIEHNECVLTNALWKACGDDEDVVNATIASQGELL